MKNKPEESQLLTFGGHLEVLRKMLFRIMSAVTLLTVLIFAFKEKTFHLLLAPKEWNFITYQRIEHCIRLLGFDFRFEPYHVNLISTELSSQFMMHITSSFYLALLGASPYILYKLFQFISPALYDNEKKYSLILIVAMYTLFTLGVLMNYFILFPISFRFLGTYQVDPSVQSTITLASYISTFSTLTFVMGLVFQLPVIAFILAKLGFITSYFMSHYRKHAFIVILILSAIITPPDLFTLILVGIPMYALYELCIVIIKRAGQ